MKQGIENVNIGTAKKHGLISEEEISYEKAKEAIRNPENFAKRIESSDIEISPGVRLMSKTIELGNSNFTNMYDIYFRNNDPQLSTKIITRQEPLYQHRLFVNKQINPLNTDKPIACINGIFFFLQDGKVENVPREIIYNLNIRDGKTLGLPAVDRTALFVTHDGQIHATELKATGVIKIGNKKIDWIGGEPSAHRKPYDKINPSKNKAILYNSACCSIEYENSEDKTSLRKLRQDLNHTPELDTATDIVVNVNEEGKLYVSEINAGGGTDFFKGNFILQISNEELRDIQIGDEVNPKTVGNINLSKIQSAITTGPMVNYFRNHYDHQINHDLSLGSFPPFASDVRYARSVIYEDKNQNIHMVVFDAIPRSQYMKGVTPQETAKNIPEDVKWAVFLDGGQSSRLTFESNKPKEKSSQIDTRGNHQYVRLHKRDKVTQTAEGEGQFLWTTRGRPLSSLIAIYRNKS